MQELQNYLDSANARGVSPDMSVAKPSVVLPTLSEVSVLPPESKRVDLPRREFLTALPEPGHFLLVIDNSSLEKIKRCHMAAAYYLYHSREGHAMNAALGFGGAVHKGLELLEHGADDFTIAKAIIQFFTDNPQPPDEYRTPQTAIEVLLHYRERQQLPDYQWEVLRDADGNLLIERPFELPLGVLEVDANIQLPTWSEPRHVAVIHVAWSGRIDLIANWNGCNRIVDHKTTKIAGDQYLASFQLSSQTIGYLWAGRQIWPEHNLRGFCLDAIHLRKPSAGVKLMDKGPRGGAPALAFFRGSFEYSDERIRQWSEDALITVEDFVHSMVRDHFPLNDRQCYDKYGKCVYHDICTIDDLEVRRNLLYSDAYKDVTWNPTADR